MVRVLIFTIAMHECESYTKRKQETQEVDAFEMGLLGNLMRITRNAVTSSQSKLLCWIKFLHHFFFYYLPLTVLHVICYTTFHGVGSV